jgi:hypothetical protein
VAEEAVGVSEQELPQAPNRMPVELTVHESMMRIGKDVQTGAVELRLDTPIGLGVRIPFSEKGWADFISNGQRAVSGVQVARPQDMPRGHTG